MKRSVAVIFATILTILVLALVVGANSDGATTPVRAINQFPTPDDGGGNIIARAQFPTPDDGGGNIAQFPTPDDGGGNIAQFPTPDDGGGNIAQFPTPDDGGGNLRTV